MRKNFPVNKRTDDAKKPILPTIIILGLLLYIQGFIFVSKLNTIMMLAGGLFIFIPLFIIAFSKRKKQKVMSSLLIIISIYFIFLLIYMLYTVLRTML
ncbi:hypothetical protein N4T77_08275 [Clostridium sp. CX1]|uniref:DUF3953 domain-containing protein n=1 Tax=Clostridium tanneri TaxID=3037988 RepID=A0ABU4JWN5_9CLOT|nr:MULTISPECIES: hypothetical protein [unclassified Clostridium]MCT8976591.1 hypothetical protein [Clostridium sp. CX1]MDW8802512.1 hypothetical protein [Clostridium sp. A1-XYC3]